MSATTTDLNPEYRFGCKRDHGVNAGETIYSGTLVVLDADGYLRDGVQAAARSFAGFAAEGVDNSSGSDGDVNCEVYIDGEFRTLAAGLTADDVGEPLFMLDNQTVVLGNHASLTQRIYVGTLAQFISATECWVRPDPDRIRRARQFSGAVAGVVNTAALDFSTLAATQGYADLHVLSVESMEAYVTSGGAADGLRVVTTNYTVAAGDVTMVTDESLNTLVVTVTAIGVK